MNLTYRAFTDDEVDELCIAAYQRADSLRTLATRYEADARAAAAVECRAAADVLERIATRLDPTLPAHRKQAAGLLDNQVTLDDIVDEAVARALGEVCDGDLRAIKARDAHALTRAHARELMGDTIPATSPIMHPSNIANANGAHLG